jgi:hypothetical protein
MQHPVVNDFAQHASVFARNAKRVPGPLQEVMQIITVDHIRQTSRRFNAGFPQTALGQKGPKN